MSVINHHPVVYFGETLWNILPSGKQAGGAPINVAYHLQKLGKTPAVISKVGFDELGKQLIEMLEAKQICTDYFQIDYEKPTSVVTTIGRNEPDIIHSIHEDVAWDYIEPEADSVHLVQQSAYFVFGSLAARSKKSANTLMCLLEVANKKVFDVNLQAPFYSRSLLETLLTKADMVKLNIDELELITGWFSSLANKKDRIQLLKDRFHLHTIMVTGGSKGALLNAGDEWCECSGLPVSVADMSGSSDAFLAGVISKTIDGATAHETLDFANCLAAFVTTKKSACPDYELSDLEKFSVIIPGHHFPVR